MDTKAVRKFEESPVVTEPTVKQDIVLYKPNGEAMAFTNVKVESTLLPEMEFEGTDGYGARQHIITNLGYVLVWRVK